VVVLTTVSLQEAVLIVVNKAGLLAETSGPCVARWFETRTIFFESPGYFVAFGVIETGEIQGIQK